MSKYFLRGVLAVVLIFMGGIISGYCIATPGFQYSVFFSLIPMIFGGWIIGGLTGKLAALDK